MKAKKDNSSASPRERAEARLRAAALGAEPGSELGSEVALAKECGVSRMTARKAVDALVAEGLVERRAGVGLFACGDVPAQRSFVFLAGNLLWEPAIHAASAVRNRAASEGASFEVRDAHGDMDAFVAEVAGLAESGADGAVVFAPHGKRADEALRALADTGFRFVVVDQCFDDDSMSGVSSDNAAGGALAAGALADAGHSRVAFLGDLEADTVRERWEGFRGECVKRGMPPPLKYDISTGDRFADWGESVRHAIGRVCSLRNRPTALFCSCDAVARLAMRSLAERSVAVPREVSLIGFDDDPIAEWTSPALTTVRQDFGAMAEKAFEMLVDRVSSGGAMESARIPVQLVARESVAVARAKEA